MFRGILRLLGLRPPVQRRVVRKKRSLNTKIRKTNAGMRKLTRGLNKMGHYRAPGAKRGLKY